MVTLTPVEIIGEVARIGSCTGFDKGNSQDLVEKLGHD
jgi:hypothetical protein